MIPGSNDCWVINLNFCPAHWLKDLLLSCWLIPSPLSLNSTLCSNGSGQLPVHGENSFHVLSDSLLIWLTNAFPLTFYHLIVTLVLWGRQNTSTFWMLADVSEVPWVSSSGSRILWASVLGFFYFLTVSLWLDFCLRFPILNTHWGSTTWQALW